jgi:hypothetical protein
MTIDKEVDLECYKEVITDAFLDRLQVRVIINS